MRFYTPVIVAGIVVAFAFLMQTLHTDLSMIEVAMFQPILYVSISVIIILCVGIWIIWRKLATIKMEMHRQQSLKSSQSVEKTTEKSTDPSSDLDLLQTKLNNMEKIGKKTTYATLLVSLVIAGVLSFYVYEHLHETEYVLTSGKFLIEDLNGQQVNTSVVWEATKGDEPFHVHIVNSNLLPPEKIQIIKNAILSEKTITIPNSILDSHLEGEATYYEGWRGALMKAREVNTSLNVPVNFIIMESNEQLGEVSIILSKDQPDDIHSNTKSIVDADNHQILKSIITIYDVEDLHEIDLAAITRHEFGHALGLYPSGTQDNFIYHVSKPDYAFVSECNVEDIVSLYGGQSGHTVCYDSH